jgi:hypothetical protein
MVSALRFVAGRLRSHIGEAETTMAAANTEMTVAICILVRVTIDQLFRQEQCNTSRMRLLNTLMRVFKLRG